MRWSLSLTSPHPGERPRALPDLSRRSSLFALLTAALLGALFTLLPRPAFAGGSVSLASREVTEEDGKWKLKMSIDYGSIPQIPHIPMTFRFTPTMLYERALTDKSPEKPIINRMPLSNQQPINEGMDVGFADASGKIFKITKFDFVIRRDHGFEAGEYDLKITREDDGSQMGQIIRLVMKGDNPVVDRRAMVFAGDKKKKVDADKGSDKTDEKKDEPAGKEEPKAGAGGEPGEPPPVPPKQGGCGCRVAGEESPSGLAALAGLALAFVVIARSKRSS